MSYAYVTMKDGRQFDGPIYMWRPKLGWFSIYNNDAPDEIHLAEVESALNKGERVGVKDGEAVIQDIDLVEKARQDGWQEHPEP